MLLDNFRDHIEESIRVKNSILSDEQMLTDLAEICNIAAQAYKRGNKILVAGNGGSAADAQHLAGELVSRFYFDRPALPALALTTDTSILTAVANDYGYASAFSRQVEANAMKGDIFIGISTSGNSESILRALEAAKNKSVITVGFTGRTGGQMRELCDYCMCVPSDETPRIQESHILIAHILCSTIEQAIFGGDQSCRR